jgi:transcriptional regulator with XRE-family HTH domain
MNAKDTALARRLGGAVRRRRNDLGWSQAVLAERIEASVEYISMLERGARLPSVPTLVALAQALGLSSDELLGATGARVPSEDALVVLARAVPRQARPFLTRMLAAVADPAIRTPAHDPWGEQVTEAKGRPGTDSTRRPRPRRNR